jgi:hypothetical protein
MDRVIYSAAPLQCKNLEYFEFLSHSFEFLKKEL